MYVRSPRLGLSYEEVAHGFVLREWWGILRPNPGEWSPLYVGLLPVGLALWAVVRVPAARFVKYLGRLERLPDLTPGQMRALCLALEYCCDELARGGAALRRRPPGGADARLFLGDLHARVHRNVESTLRAADVADGELLARLVRIVLASAG